MKGDDFTDNHDYYPCEFVHRNPSPLAALWATETIDY